MLPHPHPHSLSDAHSHTCSHIHTTHTHHILTLSHTYTHTHTHLHTQIHPHTYTHTYKHSYNSAPCCIEGLPVMLALSTKPSWPLPSPCTLPYHLAPTAWQSPQFFLSMGCGLRGLKVRGLSEKGSKLSKLSWSSSYTLPSCTHWSYLSLHGWLSSYSAIEHTGSLILPTIL